MKEVSVADLNRAMKSEEVQLIDVREYPEFAAMRIAGAKLIPLRSVKQRIDEIDFERPVYVVCRTGRRSAEAAQVLAPLAKAGVFNVAGGVVEWKRQQFPTDQNERAPWSLERQVRFVAGLIVFTSVVLSMVVHPYFVWLAALVGAGLTFAGATNWCGMAMLLARMPWNRSVEESN